MATFDEDEDGEPVPTYNMAEIKKKPGTTLVAGTEYNFKVTVNELHNAPSNTQAIDVRVMLVLDNVPPEFNTGQPTTATVVERASGAMIETFVGSDANHQAVTFAISHKALRADRDADQDEIDNIKKINDDADAILKVSFDRGGFASSGVLKTLARDKKSDSSQPNFNETPLDDPDTLEDESDVDPVPVNEYTVCGHFE